MLTGVSPESGASLVADSSALPEGSPVGASVSTAEASVSAGASVSSTEASVETDAAGVLPVTGTEEFSGLATQPVSNMANAIMTARMRVLFFNISIIFPFMGMSIFRMFCH